MKLSFIWVKRIGLAIFIAGVIGTGAYYQIRDTYKFAPLSPEDIASTENAPNNPFYVDYSMMDKKDAAIRWNEWGNVYTHEGHVSTVFQCYCRAIELNPQESVFYQNMATSLFLYRRNAKEYFAMNEQQVFDTALRYYNKALILDAGNYELAKNVAETYYGIAPLRFDAAMAAWEKALKLAQNEAERQEIYLHFARLESMAGQAQQAQAHLDMVNLEVYFKIKAAIERRVQSQQAAASHPAHKHT